MIHKENGGLASARNAGLRIASGKYLLFVDSDDWIDCNTVMDLVSLSETTNVDFIRFRPMFANWPNHPDGSLCDFGTEDCLENGLFLQQKIVDRVFPSLFATPDLKMGCIVSVNRSFYNRDFLMNNHLFFNEDVKYSEDSIFSIRLVLATNSFYYLDGPHFYHYYYNSNSITKSFKPDRWDVFKVLFNHLDELVASYKKYDFFHQLQLLKIHYVLVALSQRGFINDVKEREEYCKLICTDPVTKKVFKHLGIVKVPIKQRVFLQIIKLQLYKILARI